MKKDLFIENEKASLIQDLINDDDLLILVIRKKIKDLKGKLKKIGGI